MENGGRAGSLGSFPCGGGWMEKEKFCGALACKYKEKTSTGDEWELLVCQTDREITLGCGTMMRATYDRETGRLVRVEMSLIGGALEAILLKVEPALERAWSIVEMRQEGQDVQVKIDPTGDKPGLWFCRMIGDREVKVEPGGILTKFPCGDQSDYFPDSYWEWHGPSPLFGLPVQVILESQGLSVAVQGETLNWVMPVAGLFCGRIDGSEDDNWFKETFRQVFPTINLD